MQKIYILLIITIVFSVGCDSSKKPAIGIEDEIFVFADSLEYLDFEASMLQVFNKVIYTPQPENLFELIVKDISKLNKLKKRKNIIIVAPLNTESKTSEYIRNTLDSTVTSLVKEDSQFVFNKYDVWATGQLVMFITSKDVKTLNKNLLENADDLIYYFKKISDKRLSRSLYKPLYEDEKTEATLLNDHEFIMYVQTDYTLAKNDTENNFIWLRRAPDSELERWIFTYYEENSTPENLNINWITKTRNQLTEKYYRTRDNKSFVEIADYDEIPEYHINSREINFLGKYAIMTEGFWRMNDKSMGGPFINYTFYDEESKRTYMLDGSIFAPKYYKKKLIQQVDILLQSFKTKNEITEDKIEDLKNYLEE